jgi:hypothetical protein
MTDWIAPRVDRATLGQTGLGCTPRSLEQVLPA